MTFMVTYFKLCWLLGTNSFLNYLDPNFMLFFKGSVIFSARCSVTYLVMSGKEVLNEITSAYMVFHVEGLTGIELHYTAQLNVWPIRGFENSSYHFPAAESALPAVDKPPTDVPSPSYHSSGLLRT